MTHLHEPSDYAVNMNASEGRPLWCDRCGERIEYAGPDAIGLPTFRTGHDIDANGQCRSCGDVLDCGCPFRAHGFRHGAGAPGMSVKIGGSYCMPIYALDLPA